MGQKFRDEAGNIWEQGPGGQPRLVSQAQSGGPQVVVPQPQKPEPPKFIPGATGYTLGPNGEAVPITGLPNSKTTWKTLSLPEKMERGLDPAGDYQVSSDGQITSITSPRNQQNQLSATERSNAIQGYTDAHALERLADQLEQQFGSGIGKTKGLAGLQDYLPTSSNRAFNDKSFQARGLVKRALGFTGGEGNTIGEIQLNYGPYLPEASDYDQQIVNKIQSLRQLASDARTRSVAVLGGVPDANGKVTPIGSGPQGDVAPSSSSDGSPTSGAGYQRDPALSGVENEYRKRLARGQDAGALIGFLKKSGVDPDPGLVNSVREQVKFRRENPKVPLEHYDTTRIEMRWREGMNRPVFGINPDSPAGAYGIAAANALTGGTLDELAGGEAQRSKEILAQKNPGATLAGNISGAALGMTGVNGGLRLAGGRLAALGTRAGGIGGDVLYGGAYGAGESNDDRLGGAMAGAGSALAGNLVGRGIISGAGRAVRGVSDPNLQYLNSRNIPLTPGQIAGQGGMMGRGLRAVEDTLESVPFLGSAIRSRKAEGLQAFNREAFKDALAPINQQLEGDIGQEAIGQAQDLVSDSYGDALSGVRMRADRPFISQTDDILQRGSAVPVMGDQFNYLVGQKLDPLFGTDLSIDGRGFQSALQTLSKAGSDFPKQGIMGGEVAGHTREMRDAFIDLAGRQAPGAMPALNAANAANKNVSILGDAVTGAVNNSVESGMFTPAQLARKAVENTKKYGGKKSAARGNVPFRDLTESGQAVMPNVVPNPGTADRMLATLALPAVLGGSAAGSGALGLDPSITATLGTLALLSTRKGNNAIQRLALSRGDKARLLGEQIMRQSRKAGMFGSATAIPLLGN